MSGAENELVTFIDGRNTGHQKDYWSNQDILDFIDSGQGVWWGLKSQGLVGSIVFFHKISGVIDIGFLETLGPFRGRGMMGFLLEALMAHHRSFDFWLDVHQKNRPALSLYKRLGFLELGRRRSYYSDGGDCLLMTCFQNASSAMPGSAAKKFGILGT